MSVYLSAQFKPYQRFTEADGLVDNTVQDLVIDKEGYLWVATNNGVSKYDGEKFVNFQKKDGLLGNYAWALAVDDNNNVWVGCYKEGLNLIRNDSVVASYKMKLTKYNNSIRKLHYSSNYKMLFVGTDDGLFYFNDSIFTQIKSPRTDDRKCSVLAIEESSDNLFFSVHGSGRGMFEVVKDSTEQNSLKTIQRMEGDRFAIEVIEDTVFSNDRNKIDKWSLNSNQLDTSFVDLSSSFLAWDMTQDREGSLLLSGWGDHDLFTGGIKKYDSSIGMIRNIPFDIEGKSFMTIIHDSVNNLIWAGGDGLYAIPNCIFEYRDWDKNWNVSDVVEVSGMKYFLTNQNIFNDDGEEVFSYSLLEKILKRKVAKYVAEGGEMKGLDRIFSFSYKFKPIRFIKTNGQVYLMTNHGSISFPDCMRYYPFESGWFSLWEENNAYWVRDYNTMLHCSNINSKLKFEELESKANSIRSIKGIVEKGDTLLFPSHFFGMFSLVNGKAYELNSSHGLDDILTDMEVAPDGSIWCTSVDGNLFNVGFKDSLFVRSKFNYESGLIGTKFNWLKFHQGFLYLATNKGLNIVPVDQLNQQKLKPLFYNENNGYNYILSKKPQIDSDGRLYVYDDERLIYIDVPEIGTESLVIRTKFFVNGEELELLDGISLSHSRNNILVSFNCLRFPTTKNLTYQYRINERDWLVGNEIRLESLQSDKYSIDLRIVNKEDGAVSSKNIQFKIRRAFWEQWCFILLVLLIVGITIYYHTNKRIKRIRKDAEERQNLNHQLNEIRIRSLQGQMNPHFIFNALNSVQYFILVENVEEALTYLGNLAGVIRQNLNNLGEELIKLDDEVKFIKQYLELEKLRFKERLTFEVNTKIQSEGLKVPPMLIQPFVENAIKHGLLHKDEVGKVQVDIIENDDTLTVIIEDNGIGRERAKEIATDNNQRNGKATDITKKRLNLLNQKFKTNNYTFKIEDVVGEYRKCEGTKVYFTLMLVK
ncbi:sensor histidine kinase [Labilibacter marinus]|uniref:sensor histidine kinase n=1 Tax=Labilibacter marinus TaxID=1477105 RepID=UPI00130159E7|nr:histidine kinase [Labilibacter marinus]